MEPKFIFVGAVALFTLVSAICDVRTKRIPNWLTVPALVAALIFHTVTGGLAGLGSSLLGFLTGFGILFLLWMIGGGGAGDAKLMGALGAWLGVWNTLYVFLVSTILVIVLSILVLSYQALRHGGRYVVNRYVRGPMPSSNKRRKLSEDQVKQLHLRRRIMPYGLPVALGTWLVLAWQWKDLIT